MKSEKKLIHSKNNLMNLTVIQNRRKLDCHSHVSHAWKDDQLIIPKILIGACMSGIHRHFFSIYDQLLGSNSIARTSPCVWTPLSHHFVKQQSFEPCFWVPRTAYKSQSRMKNKNFYSFELHKYRLTSFIILLVWMDKK